jgi:type IV pilus assembly protein PilW
MTSPSYRGFSLIEMMIAITIGMFILAAMVIAYTSGKQTYRVQENLSRVQENGRFALETIARDIRLADYNGCYSKTVNPVNNLNTSTAFAYNFTVGIEGSEATAANTWSPTLDASISGASPPPKSMTDVITVRGPAPGTMALYPTPPYMTTTAAAIHLDAGTGFQVGDVVVISDCSSANIFQITNMTQSSSSSQVSVVHNSGAGSPGNLTSNLSKIYLGDAELMKIQTLTYYIGTSTCVGTNTCVAGTSSLWRKAGTNAPEELAEGVDDLQILYGEDTDGDLTANRYVAANAASLVMKNVMSVRISLLLRTLDNNITPTPQTYVYPTPPDTNSITVTATASDKRLRRILTTVVNLRNHTL